MIDPNDLDPLFSKRQEFWMRVTSFAAASCIVLGALAVIYWILSRP